MIYKYRRPIDLSIVVERNFLMDINVIFSLIDFKGMIYINKLFLTLILL